MATYKTFFCKTLLVGMLLTLVSCEDWLEIESPANRTTNDFYKTPSQAEQALLGIYNGLMPLPEYTLLMSDGRSDDVWTEPATDKPRDYVDISIFNPNIYTISTLNSAWSAYYKIIARANLFLEKIEELEFEEGEVNVKSTFMAEARFLRAYSYFELVRYFGRVPISLKSLDSDEAMNIPQSEPEETYEQVNIPDLEYAIENMKEVAYNSTGGIAEAGRATNIAAKALLGRVYVTMAGFPLYDLSKAGSAKTILKEVIDYADSNGKYWAKDGEEWKRIWVSDNDNKYHIFEIQYVAEKDYGNPIVYLMAPHLGTDYVGIQMSGNSISPSDTLTDIFKNKADVRYAASIEDKKGGYFSKFFEHKIKRKELGYSDIDAQIVDRTYFPINYPLIRLEDVMLMYAELAGPKDNTAVEVVNRIRVRAGLSTLTDAQKTEQGFDKCVDEERRRELCVEGIRWHDLVRRNQYREALKAKFMRKATDENGLVVRPHIAVYAENVREGTYLYPIPDKQMKAREGLYEQNPAYK